MLGPGATPRVGTRAAGTALVRTTSLSTPAVRAAGRAVVVARLDDRAAGVPVAGPLAGRRTGRRVAADGQGTTEPEGTTGPAAGPVRVDRQAPAGVPPVAIATRVTTAVQAARRRALDPVRAALASAGLAGLPVALVDPPDAPGVPAARFGLRGQRAVQAALAGPAPVLAGLTARQAGLATPLAGPVGQPGPPIAQTGPERGETESLRTRIGDRTGESGRTARRAAARQRPAGRLGQARNVMTSPGTRPGRPAAGAMAGTERPARALGPRAGVADLIGRRAAVAQP
jgi:hypothetical protein